MRPSRDREWTAAIVLGSLTNVHGGATRAIKIVRGECASWRLSRGLMVVVALTSCGGGGSASGPTSDDRPADTTVVQSAASSTPATDVASTTTGTQTIPETPGYTPEPSDGSLHRGVRGVRVRALQAQLTALGYDVGPADGLFGAKTQRAVRRFQSDKGLKADGVVGPQTQASLDDACRQSSKCPAA